MVHKRIVNGHNVTAYRDSHMWVVRVNGVTDDWSWLYRKGEPKCYQPQFTMNHAIDFAVRTYERLVKAGVYEN